MKTLILIISLTIYLSFSVACYCQDYAELIQQRIVEDAPYSLNLKKTREFSGKVLAAQTSNLNIFKTNIDNDKQSEDYQYSIYYYDKDGWITPLAILQYRRVTEKEVGTQKTVKDSEFVYSVSDFEKLYNIDKQIVDALITVIEKNEGTKTYIFSDTLEIETNKIEDRKDYYNGFAAEGNNHFYQISSNNPKTLPPTVSGAFSIPGGNFSVSYNHLKDSTYIGSSCGLEAGLSKDYTLNLLEYQNPVWNVGPFFYMDFGSNSFVTDIKLLFQKRFDNKKLLHTKSWPIFDFDEVQINKGTGFAVDAHILGSLWTIKLPFINFYWSNGRKEGFKNPVFQRDVNSETKQSYYSLNQIQMSVSFFWNTDNNNYNKFKLDVGAGSYDIWSVLYDKDNNVIDNKEINKFPQWLPLFAFEYIHSHHSKFGASIRYFDNCISFNFWLKLLNIKPFELRVEESYVSESFNKVIEDWEHKQSSNMMQLVFRYGLN